MGKVLVIDLDIKLYGVFSIKDKRNIKNKIIDKLKRQFNISIIESANQDVWNIISLTIAYAGISLNSCQKQKNSIIFKLEEVIESYGQIFSLDYDIF